MQNNPLVKALEQKPAANRERNNKAFRKEQREKSYMEQGASRAQIEFWNNLSNAERSEKAPWQVTLPPHPPSSPPPAQKMPLTPHPPSYPKVLEKRGVNMATSTGGLNNENPANLLGQGGSRKTKKKRSNLKQKSRMVNKKNSSRRKRRN
jgi:hypothetical protein